MASNKLIITLSSFSSDDWKGFKKFVIQFSSKKTDPYQLLEYLYKNKSSILEEWDTDKVYQRLFPKIEKKTFLNMMSQLYKWSEEWLVRYALRQENILKDVLLLKELNRRGLYHLANQKASKVEKEIDQLDHKHLSAHSLAIQFYHTLYFSDNPIKQDRDDLLYQLTDHFCKYILQYSLVYRTELFNWENIYGQKDDITKNFLDTLIDISTLPSSHYLVLMHNMIVGDDYKSFDRLRDFVMKTSWDAHSEIHQVLVIYLIRWCMIFWHKGKIKDPQTIVALYDYGLKSKVLLNQGRIPEIRFHNIISTIGALSSDDSWSLNFITQWSGQVASRDPGQNRKLALAQYHFYRDEYGMITSILRDVKFDSHGQQIRMMGLQLIAWFEERSDYPDVYMSFVSNFKKTLSRHKKYLSDHYYESHYNLIQIVLAIDKHGVTEQVINLYNSFSRIIYRTYLIKKLRINEKEM